MSTWFISKKYPGYKKTPECRGFSFVAYPPHLAEYSAGVGTLPNYAGGLPGFIGPFPSTSLDESFKDTLNRV
jgi:hypothetical protein